MNWNKKILNQKGVISFAVIYLLVIILILFLFLFIVPFSITFNTKLMAGASTMLESAHQDVNNVEDVNVRASLNNSLTDATDTITESTENLSIYFQFAWVRVPIIITMIFFVFTRTNVERGLV